MEKKVMIGGKEYRMRASALIPRLYRFKLGRDMVADMNQLTKSYQKILKSKNASEEEKQDAQFSVADLTIFENVAFMMVKHAGEDIPDTPEEWLDSIEGVFSIYEILPDILSLWSANNAQTSTPGKK